MRQILNIYSELGQMAGALSSVLRHFFTTANGAQAHMPDLDENAMRVAAHFARDLIHWIHEHIDTVPTQRSLILPWHSNTMEGSNYMLADLRMPYMLLPEFTRWLNTTHDVVGSYTGSYTGPPHAQGVRSEARSPTPANGECNRAEEGGAEEDLLWPTEDEDNDPEELEKSPNKQVFAAWQQLAVASPRQDLSVEWLRVLLIRGLAWPNTLSTARVQVAVLAAAA